MTKINQRRKENMTKEKTEKGTDKTDKLRHTINEGVLSVKEAAGVLGISIPTIYRLFDTQSLKNFHIGRRRLVSLPAINEFINNKEKREI